MELGESSFILITRRNFKTFYSADYIKKLKKKLVFRRDFQFLIAENLIIKALIRGAMHLPPYFTCTTMVGVRESFLSLQHILVKMKF